MNNLPPQDAGRPGASRRDFLKHTAVFAGAAAAGIAASQAAARPALRLKASVGKAPTVPVRDGEPLRIGVIGTGGMGRAHCGAILRQNNDGDENVRIVAVADPWHANRKQGLDICKRQSDVEVDDYVDYRDLLKRDDIHGVLIASPEHWHAQMAVDAVAAGKHIYLEKPMTLKYEEAFELRRILAENPQIVFQVGTQMMRLPRYHEARKVIREGLIGPATFSQTSYCRNSPNGEWNYYHVDENWKPGVDVDWDLWLGPAGSHPWNPYVLNRWRRYRNFSTGIAGDLLVHVMTPLMLALDAGWPVRVVASGAHIVDKEMENHDQVNITVEFENGHVMILAGSTCNEVGLETIIRGHKGNIYLGGRHCVIRPERPYADILDQKTIEVPDIGNDLEAHRLDWLQCMRTGDRPSSGVDLGTQVVTIIDLATRSMWDGHAYTFDPETLRATRV